MAFRAKSDFDMKFLSLLFCLLLSPLAVTPAQSTDSKGPRRAQTRCGVTPSQRMKSTSKSVAHALDHCWSHSRVRCAYFSRSNAAARSLARIADALWQVDGEQARLLFRKAWDAAEVADQESEGNQEEIEQQKARTGGPTPIVRRLTSGVRSCDSPRAGIRLSVKSFSRS